MEPRLTPIPPTEGVQRVEALVKAVAVFLSGLTVTLAGAFIRSCDDGLQAALAHSWCGPTPLHMASTTHQHCAGCVMLVAGAAVMAISLALAPWPPRLSDQVSR